MGTGSRYREINGLEGVVLGMPEDEADNCEYAVGIFETEETWVILETALVPTGRHMKHEEIYDGTSIKVIVDPETGEGKLSE